jgi:hypothetical protein
VKYWITLLFGAFGTGLSKFTPANIHDSRELDTLICGDKRSVFADKAYADDDVKKKLCQKGVYCEDFG